MHNGKSLFSFLWKSRINDITLVFMILLYIVAIPLSFLLALFSLPGLIPIVLYRELILSSVLVLEMLILQSAIRLVFVRSDEDFLFNFGIRPGTFIAGLFVFMIIIILPFFLLLLLFLTLILGGVGSGNWITSVMMVSFFLLFSFLSLSTLYIKKKSARIFMLIVALLCFSSLFGNPLSPGSVYSGNPLVALVSAISFTAISSFLLLRYSSRSRTMVRISFISRRRLEIRKPIDFANTRGAGALYKKNLSEIQVATWRTSTFRGISSGRMRIYFFLVIDSAIFVAFVILVIMYGQLNIFSFYSIALLEIAGIIIILFPVFLSTSISLERIWISMNFESALESTRHMLISKSLLPSIAGIPFVLLSLLSLHPGLHLLMLFGYAYAGLFPGTLIAVYLSGLAFIPQLKDDFLLPEVSPAGIVPVIPYLIFLLFCFLSLFDLLLFVYAFISICVIALILIVPKRLAVAPFRSMIRRGFI